ncbi:MAG: hypothetical protein U5N10_06850 [Gemmobacter sp.]|nr:hypothetical protein [Gemmobacter sp.]
MRALVVYCHPSPHSFNAAVRDLVLAKLAAAGPRSRLHGPLRRAAFTRF